MVQRGDRAFKAKVGYKPAAKSAGRPAAIPPAEPTVYENYQAK